MCVGKPGRAFFEASELDRLSGAYPLAPAVLRHGLVDHPLLTLSALAEAADELPAEHVERRIADAVNGGEFAMDAAAGTPIADRSEEHTSELQSLMRLSYAVFCLKKKNKIHRDRDNSGREQTRRNKLLCKHMTY